MASEAASNIEQCKMPALGAAERGSKSKSPSKQTMAELKVAKTGGKSEQQKNAHTRNLKKMMNLTDSLADSEMVN